MKKFSKLFLIIVSISFAVQVFAQSSDGSTGPIPPTEPAEGGTTPSTTTPVKPKTIAPKPRTPKTIELSPSPTTVETDEITPETSSNDPSIVIALGAVVLGILGFFGLKFKKSGKKEKEEDNSKCLNFKKLMEDKLKNLTDWKSQLGSLAEKEMRKQIKNAVEDTGAEKLLILIESGEKEYNRLKELYERCMLGLSVQKTTLLFLHKPQEHEILLAMKKRRFGEGKWNGVGGKLNKDENIKEALVRETQEEIAVKIRKDDLTQIATIHFSFENNPDWDQEAHVFFIEKWEGIPAETEEMSPKWYKTDALPYNNMWIDDIHWLPLVLEGKKLNASFAFNKSGDKILDMKINEV